MTRGTSYPRLNSTISWHDKDFRSEVTVWARSCGDVALIVELVGRGWQWTAVGWQGVRFGGGEAHSRLAAKNAAVYWWGAMTVADRKDELEDSESAA